MSSKRLVSARASRIVAGLALAVPAFVYGASASGQAPARTAQPQPVAAAAHKGIMVHGQWKILVKNADGTVASTTQFENSLVDSGFTAEHLMLGSVVAGTWGVGLMNPTATQSPCASAECLLVTSVSGGQGANLCAAVQGSTSTTCFGGLAYTVSGNTFQLSGSFASTQVGTITSVQTIFLYCTTDQNTASPTAQSTVSPSTCAATPSSASGVAVFTSATTPAFTPVAVTNGQSVQVTVVVSFS